MIELLIGSQQLLAKDLAEYMGIKIIGHKYVCKEASTIYTIQKVFEGISIKRLVLGPIESTFVFLSINQSLSVTSMIKKTETSTMK